MITPAYSPTATERVLPRMALDFTTGVLDSRVTVTRALNTATRVNSSGLIEIVNADLPRFDYDPVTLLPKGLLIEETRANLLVRSAEFDNASWIKDATTVTANATTAPDGTSAADKVIATATTAFHAIRQSRTNTVAAYTYSVYAKASEYSKLQFADGGSGAWSATFDLATGATIATGGASVLSSAIQAAGNGWYRCSVTFTGAAAFTTHSIIGYPNTGATLNNFGASYTGDGTSGVFMWGAQLELGAFATSYIPTTTTSLTRNADVVEMTSTNFSSWFNASEGTFALSGSIFVNQGATTVNFLQVSNGLANSVSMVLGMFDLTGPLWQVQNTTTSASLDLGTLTLNTVFNMAGTYKVDSFAGALNGGTVQTDSTGTIPTVSLMGIGNRLSGPYMNGHVRKIQYWPQRLLNAEVQAFSK